LKWMGAIDEDRAQQPQCSFGALQRIMSGLPPELLMSCDWLAQTVDLSSLTHGWGRRYCYC
jgi:hypothetical protein